MKIDIRAGLKRTNTTATHNKFSPTKNGILRPEKFE